MPSPHFVELELYSVAKNVFVYNIETISFSTISRLDFRTVLNVIFLYSFLDMMVVY
jgi:hypothetical protein